MLAAYSVKRNQEEGFTLIELLIVVIIIGILAAIALPIFIDQQKVAVDASVQSDTRNGVTNITNAQAQGAGTEATLPQSRSETKFYLDGTEVVDTDAAKAGVQFAVPALGTPYILAATNNSGKKYSDGDAFTFTAVTGKFTTDAAPAAGNGGTGGGTGGTGGSTYTPPASESAAYYGNINNGFYFGGAGQANTTQGGGNQYLSLSSGYGETKGFYKTSGATSVSGVPFLSGLDESTATADPDDGSHTIIGGDTPTNVQFLDASGTPIAGLNAAFADASFYYHYLITDTSSDTGQDKGKIAVEFTANVSYYDNVSGPEYTQADLDKLAGGSVTFTDANGKNNTVHVNVDMQLS